MKKTSHKRSPLAGRAIAAAAALLLGGGGLIALNVHASAGTSSWNDGSDQVQAAATIDCPDVSQELTEVPERVRPQVDRMLGLLDSQVGEAYQRLLRSRDAAQQDPSYVQKNILDPLITQRGGMLDRIGDAIDSAGQRPQGLQSMAECQLKDGGGAQPQDAQNPTDGQNQADGQNQDGQNQDGQQAGGPSPDDFVDIQSVEPNVNQPQEQQNASTGTFTSDCGVNENGKRNPDNVIVAPGVSNGAHHMHDYVGNQDNDAFANDDKLAQADTSCENQEDQSTYYWPVLRQLNAGDDQDLNADGGGKDGNKGKILTPVQVENKFVGSPVSDVVAMPRFLRIITGDAKAFTNGDANANASWSCTGFEDRQLKDKYPICPEGSQVVRTFKFQSCWDGQNIDSANHRTHVAFADDNGNCPNGFQAIPQLQQRLVYDAPDAPNFAVDSFPEQLHKPITDHGDFINVFSEDLMNQMVSCINEGRDCS